MLTRGGDRSMQGVGVKLDCTKLKNIRLFELKKSVVNRFLLTGSLHCVRAGTSTCI